MKVIFATTNNRKLEDLNNIILENKLDLEVLSLTDIGWDRGDIDETGDTIQENSLIKANAIYDYCREHGITYPIITDDAGLFVDSLGGEPGVYTARYADGEISKDSSLPKYYSLIKMLNNMQGKDSRGAEYRCAITVMYDSGEYQQFEGVTRGEIDTKINEPIKKPYFYSLFVDKSTGKPFNQLDTQELKNTYRYVAMTDALKYIDMCQDKYNTMDRK